MADGTYVETKGTILYIGGFELPDKNAAAHRVLANAKLFRLIGYRTVFVGVSKERAAATDVLQTCSSVDGFEAFSITYPNGIGKWIQFITEIGQYIQVIETISNLKAVVCYNFPAIALERMRKYCKANCIFCAADVTEWYSSRDRSLPMGVMKELDTFYRMRIVQKKLDGLIVISHFLENYYRKCKKVLYLPPLTDVRESKWKNTGAKAEDMLRLVYAGSPGKKDRIDFLIEALQRVKRKYCLDVVGIDLAAYLEMYPAHREFLSSCEQIVFHGRVPHTEALEYIKRANYSCFFRFADRVTTAGFPTKFSEAITCGTPVITNPVSDVSAYISKGRNGILVEPLTAEAITDAIEQAEFVMPVDSRLFDYEEYRKDILASSVERL